MTCWGNDEDGESTPPGGEFDSVSAGSRHSCGVKTDGLVACWGWDDEGRSTPPQGKFTSVSAGSWHTCGVESDDTGVLGHRNREGEPRPKARPVARGPDASPVGLHYPLADGEAQAGTRDVERALFTIVSMWSRRSSSDGGGIVGTGVGVRRVGVGTIMGTQTGLRLGCEWVPSWIPRSGLALESAGSLVPGRGWASAWEQWLVLRTTPSG